MKILIVSIFILLTYNLSAQIGGCTDPAASNFNVAATFNNGSCSVNTRTNNSFLTNNINLPSALKEISGMVHWNGINGKKIYSIVDSGGPTYIYEINPTNGAITKTIKLTGVSNVDWEDMTQDETHFYIGDVGNNANGARTNLRIYKFAKSLITSGGATVTIPIGSIGVINFTYSNQSQPPVAVAANSTRFDCEAIAFNRGKLHLFSKNWSSGTKSIHYILPITAGTHIAKAIDSIETGDIMITGADFGAWDMLILIGYDKEAKCAIFLDYGFDGTYYYFNSGVRRKIKIGVALNFNPFSSLPHLGQLEGICFVNALKGYTSNEYIKKTIRLGFIRSTKTAIQSIDRFNISQYIQAYYNNPANQVTYGTSIIQPGTIRFNANTKKIEGYDGNHWLPFNN